MRHFLFFSHQRPSLPTHLHVYVIIHLITNGICINNIVPPSPSTNSVMSILGFGAVVGMLKKDTVLGHCMGLLLAGINKHVLIHQNLRLRQHNHCVDHVA